MLAWISANATLVSVSVTGVAHVSGGTVTVEHAADGVCVTVRAFSTRITDTSVISMAQQTGFSERAEADEGGRAVDAGGAGAARGAGTVIDVFRAVRPTPAVNTYANVAAR